MTIVKAEYPVGIDFREMSEGDRMMMTDIVSSRFYQLEIWEDAPEPYTVYHQRDNSAIKSLVRCVFNLIQEPFFIKAKYHSCDDVWTLRIKPPIKVNEHSRDSLLIVVSESYARSPDNEWLIISIVDRVRVWQREHLQTEEQSCEITSNSDRIIRQAIMESRSYEGSRITEMGYYSPEDIPNSIKILIDNIYSRLERIEGRAHVKAEYFREEQIWLLTVDIPRGEMSSPACLVRSIPEIELRSVVTLANLTNLIVNQVIVQQAIQETEQHWEITSNGDRHSLVIRQGQREVRIDTDTSVVVAQSNSDPSVIIGVVLERDRFHGDNPCGISVDGLLLQCEATIFQVWGTTYHITLRPRIDSSQIDFIRNDEHYGFPYTFRLPAGMTRIIRLTTRASRDTNNTGLTFEEMTAISSSRINQIRRSGSDYRGGIIGDSTCRNNANSQWLRCAFNPCGPCEGCSDYQSNLDEKSN